MGTNLDAGEADFHVQISSSLEVKDFPCHPEERLDFTTRWLDDPEAKVRYIFQHGLDEGKAWQKDRELPETRLTPKSIQLLDEFGEQ
jgi:hypothetical protein